MGAPSTSTAERKEYRLKRALDLILVLVAFVVTAPLWGPIALAIKLTDRGPILYRQKRLGKDGGAFTILKFRTMVVDADQKGPTWTSEGDPRITRVGKILRRTALDELPELLSIWKGNMSWVGPRALPLEEQRTLESQIASFSERLKVRPGLTGLAQVYDRTDDARTKLHYDLQYIERMGLWLDLRLLFLSVVYTLMVKWDRRSGKAGASDER